MVLEGDKNYGDSATAARTRNACDEESRKAERVAVMNRAGKQERRFNPLALELDIYSLAHHLCKTLIFYEPRRTTLAFKRLMSTTVDVPHR